ENVNGNTTPSPRNGTSNGTSNGTANGTPHKNGVNGKLTCAYPFMLKEFVVPEETGAGYMQAAHEVVRTLEAHIAEAERLLETSEEAGLSESSADALRVASGNGKLILKKKLPKFVKLIEKNNDPTIEGPPVMVDDLRGFWDMMEPDLRSIRDAFAKVERHRLNGWSPPSEPSPVASTPKKTGPKPPIPPKPRQLPPRNASVDPAALKRAAAQQKRELERAAFMKAKREAARKALAQQNNGGEINDVVSNGNGLIHH
ncbi:Protein W03A5.4, partial [Aphelenchoides avenae]